MSSVTRWALMVFLQHESYIASWISLLENDKKVFLSASKQAMDAADYLTPHLSETLSENAEENREDDDIRLAF